MKLTWNLPSHKTLHLILFKCPSTLADIGTNSIKSVGIASSILLINVNLLWKEVVAAKHGKLNHWCTKQSRTPYGVGPWKHISKLWEEFLQEVSFKVTNGLKVKFWKDRWLGNFILKDLYPSLFLIACNADSTVAQNREGNSGIPSSEGTCMLAN